MKQKIIFFALISLLAGILITCQKDETDKLPPINKEAELSAAQQWYNSRFGELTLKSAVEDSSRASVVLKPEWKTAKVHHNRRLKTVETILLPQDTALFFASPENMQKYQMTGDERYFMSLTRLVLQTHRRTGRQTGFLMTIMPSVKYLEQTNFNPFRRVAYIGRDKKFDGRIFFHHLDGTFSNGWTYRNGKITHSVKPLNSEHDPIISLKSSGSWECTVELTYGVYRKCYYTCYESNGQWIITHEECDPNTFKVLEEEIKECVWNGGNGDDEFGDGDENSGNGGPGGSYTPDPPEFWYITIVASPSAGGSVIGGGHVLKGSGRFISATPIPGYTFVSWSGDVSANSATYFIPAVNSSMNIIANFQTVNTGCSTNATQNSSTTNSVLNNNSSTYHQVAPLINQLKGYASSQSNEWGLAVQYDSNEYWVYNIGEQDNPTYFKEGTPNSISIKRNENTYIMAHTHPSGQGQIPAPSPGDAIALAKAYNDGSKNITANVIFAADSSEYMVYVANRGALDVFCKYSPNIQFFNQSNGANGVFQQGTVWANAYNTMYATLQAPPMNLSDNDAQLYALAYVLDTFYTGLKIYKKDKGTNDFKEKRLQYSNNNYSQVTCP